MLPTLLSDKTEEKHLLLGNEAIVRGAVEAGVGFISCYPGTPSSEVPDTLYSLAPYGNFDFEYSVNEKVALEVGGGAALGGTPTLVTMKHVGLNVAADPLMSICYVGTPGGLVILNADDPGAHSSQNEQDNRYYCRQAGLPCFEPATAQEAKDMLLEAFQVSVKYEHPVMLRTTTRLNHLRQPVVFGPIKSDIVESGFSKNPQRFVLIPAVARKRHPVLLEKVSKLRESAEESEWNKTWGEGSIGIICSGIARSYLSDVLQEENWENKFAVMELGFTHPLPESKIISFLKKFEKIIVLEELDPVLENDIRSLAQKHAINNIQITGKETMFPCTGEYSTRLLRDSLGALVEENFQERESCPEEENLPQRPPNLCPGCSHRAVFYAVRKVFGDEAVYSTDIGCYTLGILPPLKAADFLFCMGSSISGGSGMARASGREVISYIGDSTFFHSGVTGLINAVHNRHNQIVIILDNKTTAMTGHQPHPGVDHTVRGSNESKVDIEKLVRGCGVETVRKIKPFQHQSTLQVLQEVKELSGVRVIIAEEPCVLFARRTLGKKQNTVAYVSEDHPSVRECLEELACPAFYLQGDQVGIDENQCTGCMLCVQVCDYIKAKKRN